MNVTLDHGKRTAHEFEESSRPCKARKAEEVAYRRFGTSNKRKRNEASARPIRQGLVRTFEYTQ